MSALKFIMIFLVAAIFAGSLEAQGIDTSKQVPSDYYVKGKQAYDDGDLIGAIKYLFAYKVSRQGDLSDDQDFLATVDAVLEQSEKALRDALDKERQRVRWLAITRPDVGDIYSATGPGGNSSIPSSQVQVVKYQLLEKQIELKRLELEKLHLEAELSEENKIVE